MNAVKEVLSLIEEAIDGLVEQALQDERERLRSLPLEELLDLKSDSNGKRLRAKKTASASRGRKAGKGGKRVRRSHENIQAMTGKLHTVVKHAGPDGISAEDIRKELDIERKELPRLIAEALKQRLITKRGQKRATMYFAGSKNASGAKKAKKAAPKKAKAKAKKSAPKKAKKASSKKAAHANGMTAAATEASPSSAE